MAILPILIAPDKRLKRKAVAVKKVTPRIRQLMDDMLETMYAAPGVGLAAPQVGESVRVIVVDVAEDRAQGVREPIQLANPKIIASEGDIVWEEGCLSVPEYTADVNRKEYVKVRGLNRDGVEVEIEAVGLFAVCLQHEIDHLNGVLFIDHISRLKREMAIKRLKKMKAEFDS